MILKSYLLNEGLFNKKIQKNKELPISDELRKPILDIVKNILFKYNKDQSYFNLIRKNMKELKSELIDDGYSKKEIDEEYGNLNNPPKFKPSIYENLKTEISIVYIGDDYPQEIYECYELYPICKDINSTELFKQNNLKAGFGDGDEGCIYITKTK